MAPRTLIDIHNIRMSIERIGNISDSIVNVGPVRFGLDAILEVIPFAGEIYSMAAGGMLIIEGIRARLPLSVLVSAVALIALRTAIGSPDLLLGPLLGAPANLIAGAFRAHQMVARMMLRAIDETNYVEMSRAEARGSRVYEQLIDQIRDGTEKKRIIFLGQASSV